jgi:hypothetical protein
MQQSRVVLMVLGMTPLTKGDAVVEAVFCDDRIDESGDVGFVVCLSNGLDNYMEAPLVMRLYVSCASTLPALKTITLHHREYPCCV